MGTELKRRLLGFPKIVHECYMAPLPQACHLCALHQVGVKRPALR